MFSTLKPRLYNAEPQDYSPEARAILSSRFEVIDAKTTDKWPDILSDIDVLIVRLGRPVTTTVLDAAPKLKVIATATTGLNHIDLTTAEKRNIAVLSLRGERDFLDKISATAELTWGLLLGLLRNIPAAVHSTQRKFWDRNLFKGHDLSGKTLGVVGYGRLGNKVAQYGVTFGMTVIANDIEEIKPEKGVTMVSIADLIAKSDVVSLHIDYSKQNRLFWNKEKIDAMKTGSYLINTSRGELLDETALLTALQNGHLAGAALDVLSGENTGKADWVKDDALLSYAHSNNNLLITPHIGGASFESMANTEIFIAQKLVSSFNGIYSL